MWKQKRKPLFLICFDKFHDNSIMTTHNLPTHCNWLEWLSSRSSRLFRKPGRHSQTYHPGLFIHFELGWHWWMPRLHSSMSVRERKGCVFMKRAKLITITSPPSSSSRWLTFFTELSSKSSSTGTSIRCYAATAVHAFVFANSWENKITVNYWWWRGKVVRSSAHLAWFSISLTFSLD